MKAQSVLFHKTLIKPVLRLDDILSNWIMRETKMLHIDRFKFIDNRRK